MKEELREFNGVVYRTLWVWCIGFWTMVKMERYSEP